MFKEKPFFNEQQFKLHFTLCHMTQALQNNLRFFVLVALDSQSLPQGILSHISHNRSIMPSTSFPLCIGKFVHSCSQLGFFIQYPIIPLYLRAVRRISMIY